MVVYPCVPVLPPSRCELPRVCPVVPETLAQVRWNRPQLGIRLCRSKGGPKWKRSGKGRCASNCQPGFEEQECEPRGPSDWANAILL